jgi:glycopeptide antibiotics resistance protein
MRRQKVSPFYRIIFWVYIIILFIVVVIKFNGSIDTLKHNIDLTKWNRDAGLWNANFEPLKSIKAYFKDITSWYALKNLLGNLLAFIPFGFLLPVAYLNCRNFFMALIIALECIVGAEIFQFISMTGTFDVDDILLNMISFLIGYCLFLYLRLYAKHH